MDKTGEEILDKTDLKTLWSETLLELLQEAIQSKWSDNAILEIVKELQHKGFSREKQYKMVKKKFGSDIANNFKKQLR